MFTAAMCAPHLFYLFTPVCRHLNPSKRIQITFYYLNYSISLNTTKDVRNFKMHSCRPQIALWNEAAAAHERNSLNFPCHFDRKMFRVISHCPIEDANDIAGPNEENRLNKFQRVIIVLDYHYQKQDCLFLLIYCRVFTKYVCFHACLCVSLTRTTYRHVRCSHSKNLMFRRLIDVMRVRFA